MVWTKIPSHGTGQHQKQRVRQCLFLRVVTVWTAIVTKDKTPRVDVGPMHPKVRFGLEAAIHRICNFRLKYPRHPTPHFDRPSTLQGRQCKPYRSFGVFWVEGSLKASKGDNLGDKNIVE